jgi:16S rRNA (guanine966-N2)-methyltransferase
MRIVGGAWRGRRLVAPAGMATRPSADRVRQALFDMLLHAQWGGRDAIAGARVLDAFAGTGAFGLEALSRGAAHATFMESDAAALAALRANIAALGAGDRASVAAADVLRCPPGSACGLIFLDPPYGGDLVRRAVPALGRAGWIGAGSLILAELGRADALPEFVPLLASRGHGAARLAVWRIEAEQVVTY